MSRSPDDLIPEAREKCLAWMGLCEKKGLRVQITETYRPQERQDELFAQGRTTPGRIVTWTRNSRHTLRKAWDFVVLNEDGSANWEYSAYKAPAGVATIVGCEAGYYWSKPDACHVQLFDKKREGK